MSAALALLLACGATFIVLLLLIVVLGAYGASRRITEGPIVNIARGLFITAILVIPLVAVFALGWGIGTGWAA